jgi:hypothetical protein
MQKCVVGRMWRWEREEYRMQGRVRECKGMWKSGMWKKRNVEKMDVEGKENVECGGHGRVGCGKHMENTSKEN